jgi:formylglycine-generating enzyme required for sulfatase activity
MIDKKNHLNEAKLLIEFAEKKGLLTKEQAKEANEQNISTISEIENLISSNGWLIPKELETLFKDYARHVWNHSAIQFGKIAVHNKFISKPVFDEILIQLKVNKNSHLNDKSISDLLLSKKLLNKQQIEAIFKIQNQLENEPQSVSAIETSPETYKEIKRFNETNIKDVKDQTINEFKNSFSNNLYIALKYSNDMQGFTVFIKNRLKGHYEILEIFHQKSIFFTAIAKDLYSQKKIILKVLKPGAHFSLETAVNYLNEILILSNIKHKNLAEISDFGFIDCFPYFSHLYVEGEILKTYFQNHDATIKNKIDHFLTICDTLEHLHQKFVWHKNLSSSNLVITKNEELIFLNYGISKSIQNKSSLSEYTHNIDMIIDYINFMSPEEASGKFVAVDESSEIYSLGVILYELCTGQLPYDLEKCDIFLALTKIREELPWPPAMHNYEIKEPLELIILKALAKEKSHRYLTIAELKSDLKKFLNGEDVLAKPILEETESLTIHALKSKYQFHFRILASIIVALLITVAVLASMPSKEELKLERLFNSTKKAKLRQEQFSIETNYPLQFENNSGIKMILIPSGYFEMGSSESQPERANDETQHEVNITNGFYISETEITQQQWQKVMNANPAFFKGENLPVENVSWIDTQKFINTLNENTDLLYRLPTEAEWEFACRAGAMEPFNQDIKNNSISWNKTNSNGTTHPPKQFAPNAFGLYDMHNNVWEWCLDYYGQYDPVIIQNPKGPIIGTEKVMRGGGWSSLEASSRSAARRQRKPDYISNAVGFRIVLELNDSLIKKK